MAKCACGHDWRIHDNERCRINGCGCRLGRDDEPRAVRPKREEDPKVVTFIIPVGYTATVTITPNDDGTKT